MPKRKYITRSSAKNKESQESNNDQESQDKPIKRKFAKKNQESNIQESDDDQETIATSSKTITAEGNYPKYVCHIKYIKSTSYYLILIEKSRSSSKAGSKYIKTYSGKEPSKWLVSSYQLDR